MSKSSLVDCTLLSPNNSGKRTHKIDRITPHCVVGQLSAESIGHCFDNKSRKASCNYGIGKDGRVCLVVDENNRSWCTSSSSNDQRAITIECASDTKSPYAFTNACYNKLIDLTVDICKRYDKTKLVWISNKEKALAYKPKDNELQITVHRWFANKSCPGDWLMSRMCDYADKVNSRLKSGAKPKHDTHKNEEKKKHNVTSNGLVDGSIITLKKGAVYWDGKDIPDWILKSTLYYRGKNSKGILFSTLKTGDITGIVKESAVKELNNNSNINSGTIKKSGYKVKVIADALKYRKGPGTNYDVNGVITDKGVYVIVEESNGWGKLKSGAGWINLKYTKKL